MEPVVRVILEDSIRQDIRPEVSVTAGGNIHQHLFEQMANDTEVCLVIYARLQYNLGFQLFSMPMQLNILYKLHITIYFNSVFTNALIIRI